MNYIVTSPYFPQNFQKFTIELHKAGVNVLGIGQEPYEQLDAPLKAALTEYFRVQNLEDAAEVKRAVAYLFYKHGAIDRIESQNEYWLPLDAQLREQFNVFGMRESDLRKTRYKSAMKALFIKAGVPVVPGYLVKNHKDIAKGVAELGLLLIAKPDSGVGAAATYKLTSEADVAHFAEAWDGAHPYFLEPFVENAAITTFDGLINAQGEIVYQTGITYYYTPIDLFDNPALDWTYYIEKTLDPQLVDYGHKIVKAFGMRERFFHIEFFKKANGEYIVIEYNNRPAGAFAVDVYNYTHSLDLYALYARMVCGEDIRPAVAARTEQYGLAVTRRDYKHYAHSEADIRAHYGDALKAVLRMPQAFAGLQGDVMYVLTAPTLEAMQAMERYVSEQV